DLRLTMDGRLQAGQDLKLRSFNVDFDEVDFTVSQDRIARSDGNASACLLQYIIDGRSAKVVLSRFTLIQHAPAVAGSQSQRWDEMDSIEQVPFESLAEKSAGPRTWLDRNHQLRIAHF